MSWVARALQVSVHYCRPPMYEPVDKPGELPAVASELPDGQRGDLWRCDDCGMLWRIGVHSIGGQFPLSIPEWREAGWWTRFRYRNATGIQNDPLAI